MITPLFIKAASMRKALRFAISACALLVAGTLHAQTIVTTQPVGYTTTNCLANSDTIVSIPFTQPAAYVGTVASVSGSTITLSGTAGLTANQFVYQSGSQSNTYYVLMGPTISGTSDYANDGRIYTVTANDTGSLTVNLNGDTLSAVPAGATVSVIPYWTLNTVFPAANAGSSFIASTSAFSKQTQIFVPNYGNVGMGTPTAASYFFYNGAWRLTGDKITNDHGNDVLIQSGYLTIENTATATTFVPNQYVVTQELSIPLSTSTSTQQDNPVSLSRPLGVTLNNSNLVSSGAFAASPSAFQKTDQLFVFNNSQQAINKAAATTYFYFNNGWRQVGQPITTDFGSTPLPSGSGFIIRKAISSTGVTQFWQNTSPY